MKTNVTMAAVGVVLAGMLTMSLFAGEQTNAGPVQAAPVLQESDQAEGTAEYTPLTQVESDGLARMEDGSLAGLDGGAFNPQFEPLSFSEQATLKTSEEQQPGLQDMTAGDLDDNAGLGAVTWGGLLLAVLLLIVIF